MEDLNTDLKRLPTTQSTNENQSKKLVRGALTNKNAVLPKSTMIDKKSVILDNVAGIKLDSFSSKRTDEPTAISSGNGSKNLSTQKHPPQVGNKRTSYIPSTSSMMNFMKSGG